MRIGISTSVIQRGKTGVAEYVFSLVRAFGPHTGQHQFVLFVLEEDLSLFEFAGAQAQIVIVPERFRTPMKDIAWHQIALPRLAKQLGLDVLHVPSYRRLLWSRPCAMVGTVHDLAAFHVPHKYDWRRMFYGRVVAARLARRQDALIAVSHHTARDIARFWKIPPEFVTVVHHGIEHSRFANTSRELAARFCRNQLGLRRPFFPYVARLEHPAKNHVRLIEAFARFKASTGSPWQLAFAGSDWHGAQVIHDAIARSPARADIRSLGFVPDSELPLLYRAAEVFVYPSLYEGFGFPPLQAMASGCPVLCSTRGSLKEIVGDAAAEADPKDVEGLAEQMIRLANESSLRADLKERGAARAREFDWSRTALETLRVYQSAVQRAGKRKRASDAAVNQPKLWRTELNQ